MPTRPGIDSAPPARLRRLIILLLMAPLCACMGDNNAATSIADDDYRVRHPLILTHEEATLEIFPEGAALDANSRARIRQFATDYRNAGEGPVTILLPQGTGHDEIARRSVDAIRKSLVAGGASGTVNVGVYPAFDPTLAAPVQISFRSLKAKVESLCGQWPDDLASGAFGDGWGNHPYWNEDCAYQTAFAAQVADPRDLFAPRAEAPSDVEMRTRAITELRQGNDPGTKWATPGSSIGQVGNN
jgi:pilus assembly protein CpaD